MSQTTGFSVAEPGTWTVQPEADALVREVLAAALERCPGAADFAARLHAGTGIRLADIVDHIVTADSPALRVRLASTGFALGDEAPHGDASNRDALSGEVHGDRRVPRRAVAWHDKGLFPDIVVDGAPGGSRTVLAVQVESVADFLAAQGLDVPIEGEPGGTYRRARAWQSDDAELWAIERHGHIGFDVPRHDPAQLLAAARHLEAFRRRRRHFDDANAGFDHTDALIRRATQDLGTDWTCALFLRAERDYWERRNGAAQVQKARQDALGMGWCNDDHHTYDASREWFHRTIGTLELLGFRCRERFYAGAEAGWGSQILEQPVLGTVIFADIDLAPEELTGDFAHAPEMRPLPTLRRAGLWCALHGESMLEAGINHLECTYDQRALRAQLRNAGVEMMAPFSNFPHLYQELTVGEWWPVREDRIARLLADGMITPEAAADFRARGAIGSHLENLERNQGYKGFNQPGISEVLRIIDPREFVPGEPEPPTA